MERNLKDQMGSKLSKIHQFISSDDQTSEQYHIPFIFVHGVGAPYLLYTHLVPLKKLFKSFGRVVHIAKTPSTASVEKSADILFTEIERLVPKGKFHLIGHSMGGLVSRRVLKKYELADRCISITTLATPHHGSHLADWALGKICNSKKIKEKYLKAILHFFGNTDTILEELGTQYMKNVFNKENPIDEKVNYFSLGFYIPSPLLKYTLNPYIFIANKLNKEFGFPDNDGPVSTHSSIWGTHLGDFEGDHYSETAPIPFAGKIIYKDVFKKVITNVENLENSLLATGI